MQTEKAIPREQASPCHGSLHTAGEDMHDGGHTSDSAVRVTGILVALAVLFKAPIVVVRPTWESAGQPWTEPKRETS